MEGDNPMWTISSGQVVGIGDEVALEFHPDEIGVITGVADGRGLPIIEIVAGPNRGRVRPEVSPAQILMKRVQT